MTNTMITLRPRASRANPQDLAALKGFLRGRGWTKRREICSALGFKDDALRALARYSDGAITSSSTRGYILTDEATTAEARHSVAELLSRANQLRLRAGEIIRAVHGRRDGRGAA
jgi:hypothetical protein